MDDQNQHLSRRRACVRKLLSYRNVVIRQVCDCDGNALGVVVELHDGTPEGIIHAARRATERMFAQYPVASNIQSRILASDSDGLPRLCISPDFQQLAEIETDEARYIWTGTRRRQS